MQTESLLILLGYTCNQPGHSGLKKNNNNKHWPTRLRWNQSIPQSLLLIPYTLPTEGACAERHIKICRHVKRGHSCWSHSEYLTNHIIPVQNCLGLRCLKIRPKCEWMGKITCKNEVWNQKKIAKRRLMCTDFFSENLGFRVYFQHTGWDVRF